MSNHSRQTERVDMLRTAGNHRGNGLTRVTMPAVIGVFVLLAAFFGSDIPAWKWLYESWASPSNSHGMIVPAFSAYLLWQRRQQLPYPLPPISWNSALFGALLILLGIATRYAGIYTRTITAEAASILPCVAGTVLFCGGWAAMRWAWPAVLFLVFMIPIPGAYGELLGSVLQTIATIMSTFLLQTIGIPAISEGNIICLTEKTLGVAEACSGIRMLTTFFALAAAVALVIERPAWEKLIIILSAPAIAILANVLRIAVTAVAYEFGNEKMAELIFHDLAGWLMMPAGLVMLWFELFLLSRVYENVEDQNFGSIMS